jgi:hypothetical protein
MLQLRVAMPCLRTIALLLIIIACFPLSAHADQHQQAPLLSLPTPPDEPWKILQGYGCGTHNGWDRYALDLVSVAGRTAGAPVRAAADGVIFLWVKKSGTLIIHHGQGFYTQYTHMASAVTTKEGTFVARGSVIGTAGDRGAPGTPHLHFMAFTADGPWAAHRHTVPLSFAEGYRFADVGGCSQHQGETVSAAKDLASLTAAHDTNPPTMSVLAAPLHVATGQPSQIVWPAAQDTNSDVVGYRLYIGPDPDGTSEWFVPTPAVDLPALAAGPYLLRVQTLDAAGNQSAWVTLGQIIVE